MGAPWRDTTPRLRGEFAHYVLVESGEFHAVTLNLGAGIEDQALRSGRGAKRFLSERIAHHLEVALGRTVPFWFRLEMSGGHEPRLHLHGEIGCLHAERKKVHRALRKAGGEWESSGARYQANTRPMPDNGYVSYAFKNDPGLYDRVLKNAVEPSWRDDLFMVSLDLKRRSKALYEAVRRSVRLSGRGLRNHELWS